MDQGTEECPGGPDTGPVAGGQVQRAVIPLLEKAKGGAACPEGSRQGGSGGRQPGGSSDEAPQSDQHHLPNRPHHQHDERPAEGLHLCGVVTRTLETVQSV